MLAEPAGEDEDGGGEEGQAGRRDRGKRREVAHHRPGGQPDRAIGLGCQREHRVGSERPGPRQRAVAQDRHDLDADHGGRADHCRHDLRDEARPPWPEQPKESDGQRHRYACRTGAEREGEAVAGEPARAALDREHVHERAG